MKIYFTNLHKALIDQSSSGQVHELVMNLPACPDGLKTRDYVFATRWSDADWNDPWCVGFVAELGKNYVTLHNENGGRVNGVGMRGFKNAMRITAKQGSRIISEYSPLEGTPFISKVAYKIVFDA